MIAEIGLAALWLAAALAVLQMVSGAFALNAAEGRVNPMAIYARPAAVVQALLAVLGVPDAVGGPLRSPIFRSSWGLPPIRIR